jgi:hypothetical protein
MTALPAGALAANPFNRHPVLPQSLTWQSPDRSLVLMARDNDDEEHEEHHHHHKWHGDEGRWGGDEGRYRHDDDDYNWGGRNRYQYPPSYFSAPVSPGWDAPRRQAYLERRRNDAIIMRQRMLSHGDTRAAQRLDDVIGHLNRQLRR